MSEDGDYYDEDEYYEYEDIPFNEAVGRTSLKSWIQLAIL